MVVFVYEFVTGGGFAASGEAVLRGPLLQEGGAMLRAITGDFALIPGMEVVGLKDARLGAMNLGSRQEFLVRSAEEERLHLERLAAKADFTLLIAPELERALLERVSWATSAGARLLSPDVEFVRVASSKTLTVEYLSRQKIPVPRGAPVADEKEWRSLRFPLIAKRDDGAGSMEMRLLHQREDIRAISHSINYRLEEFHPGLATSCAVLCGPEGNIALPACTQLLQPETFAYLGGKTPLPASLDHRARSLALAALAALPPTVGYVGVDMILGNAPDGREDVVIEVNPRLTTSYVGLRIACRQNIAAAMLDVATGRPVAISFGSQQVEFHADGSVG